MSMWDFPESAKSLAVPTDFGFSAVLQKRYLIEFFWNGKTVALYHIPTQMMLGKFADYCPADVQSRILDYINFLGW